MIFVTVGALLPFDRLIRLVDEAVPEFQDKQFFAQIGEGAYEPKNMKFVRLLPAPAFKVALSRCSLLVAHAGMGSIICALEINRPVVVLPRNMELGEHTTDHQSATARWLEGKQGVHVAWRGEDLPGVIQRAVSADSANELLPVDAPEPFLSKIRQYIANA